ncbi:hypothetical protein Asulf_01962 [Archaeoglobus sulfaticallidus PM70-1]|uniref:Uncharacterized protein n=1 Tax=Archaeoglobus sulfaticallidus PM70-1 TaxID=387631 RepID=N0BFX7_9EURY|nr:hypothetical protein [Archaeoglobus sulfaticallidus]AGK61928.1 hypothetical protein Asulf_01962 [Archaeoglobus sulfaticallidus PM70-1]
MKEIKIKVPDIDEILPEEVMKHLLQSYKELLMAFKKGIEYKIERIDRIEEKMTTKKKELKKIDIE